MPDVETILVEEVEAEQIIVADYIDAQIIISAVPPEDLTKLWIEPVI